MTSHDTNSSSDQALPFLDSIRQQIARKPHLGHTKEGAAFSRSELDYFSAARIYITFKVKLAEHFPESMPPETFDFLVDLIVHEWLSRRVGSHRPAELGIPRATSCASSIRYAASLGLVTIAPDPDSDDMQIVTLTRSARTRLNVFFDYMASYISVL